MALTDGTRTWTPSPAVFMDVVVCLLGPGDAAIDHGDTDIASLVDSRMSTERSRRGNRRAEESQSAVVKRKNLFASSLIATF